MADRSKTVGRADPVFPVFLDAVHGLVGQPEQVFLGLAMAGKAGESDGGGDVDAFELIPGNASPNPLGHGDCIIDIGFRKDEDKLIAPVAADNIFFPSITLDDTRYFNQTLAAFEVAEGIVDGLETVKIQEEQRDTSSGFDGIFQFGLETSI